MVITSARTVYKIEISLEHSKTFELVSLNVDAWVSKIIFPFLSVLGLVYICHGFTEHMANYNGLGEVFFLFYLLNIVIYRLIIHDFEVPRLFLLE